MSTAGASSLTPYPALDRFGPAVAGAAAVSRRAPAVGVERRSGLLPPVLPWPLLLATVMGLAVLTLAASVAPLRAALRRPPMRAYLEA